MSEQLVHRVDHLISKRADRLEIKAERTPLQINANVATCAHGNVFANTIVTIFELCPNQKCLQPSPYFS